VVDGRTLTTQVSGGTESLRAALRGLEEAAVEVTEFGLRRPTLDDVFLTLTGHQADETAQGAIA
jgi:ABC-2 type transport system ATP-binding protein